MLRPARCRRARAWPPAERRRALTGTPRTTSDKATAIGAAASTQPGWAGDHPGLWLQDAAAKIGPAPPAPPRPRAWSILVRNTPFRRIRDRQSVGWGTRVSIRVARGVARHILKKKPPKKT